jgi:hypothetical protein
MKVKFVTYKTSEAAFREDLAPFQTKGNLSLNVRPHAKDEKCIWIELENNKDMMQENFRRYLKMREREKKLRSLFIYEFDTMGRPTVNGVIQESAKA